jgi:RNA polymerase sigma-70 factor, ECF subfamily
VVELMQPGTSAPADDRAFSELLQPLIEPGFRLALAMLRDAAAAEDVVQDAAITAWQKIGRLQDRDKLRPWFLGVVANNCRNARRRKWVADVSIGVPETLSVVSAEDQALRGADLRQAVARLGYEDRLTVVLYFYLDMSVDEVAGVTGKSVSAARAKLYRAVNKLRPDIAIEEALR